MLLNLPPEIIIDILCKLSLRDIASCMLTHSSIHAIIRDHQIIQYHIATQVAGVDDNAANGLAVSERLALLRSREEGWAKGLMDFRRTVPVRHVPSGIYDMAGGIYLLGDQDRQALHYCVLPSKPTDEVNWTRIDVDRPLIDMGLCIYEHDLIAVVTTTPRTHMHAIEIQLLQFSTGKPHPLASNPRIFVSETRWPRPSIGIEIVGDNLALVTTHFLNPFHPHDEFYVFAWKTGDLKMHITADYHTYSGLVFLSPDTVVLPNTTNNSLDIYRIPSTPAAIHKPACVLGLPRLAPGQNIITISCRGEPNPSLGGQTYSSQPFNVAAEDAIVIFNVRVGVGFALGSTFSMYVKRSALLGLCPKEEVGSESAAMGIIVPSGGIGGGAGSSDESHGGESHEDESLIQPATFILATTPTSPPVIVTLEPPPPPASASSSHVQSLDALVVATLTMPYAQWGPPCTRWLVADDMPTRWITTTAGQRCVVSTSPDVWGGDWDDEEEEDDVGAIVLDFNKWSVRDEGEGGSGGDEGDNGRAVAVVTDYTALNHEAFADPVESRLPYRSVALSRAEMKGFEGVLMDEERLVGLRTDAMDMIREIEVMHIGAVFESAMGGEN